MKFHIRFAYTDKMLCGRTFATARVPFVSTSNTFVTPSALADKRVDCQKCLAVAGSPAGEVSLSRKGDGR